MRNDHSCRRAGLLGACSTLSIGLAGMLGLAAASTATAGTPTLQEWAGQPLANLSVTELARFDEGSVEFNRTFLPGDGLGPIFNQNSCASCHSQPVGGSGSIFVTRFGGADKDGNFITFPGGSLLQANSIDPDTCLEVIPDEAFLTAKRITSSTMGAGLVEAIPASAIIANEDNPPAPWISGRIHWVEDLDAGDGSLIIGRFGWKGQLGTNIDFSADASFQEMGITNRIFDVGNAPNGDMAALEVCDPFFGIVEDQPDPKSGLAFIDRVSDFQRFLAPPPQTPQSGMTGEALFNQIGCNHCHVSSYITSDDPGIPQALRNRLIRPYSDFLLHDMGINADFIGQGDASPTEIRTPPLWGLRLRDPIWHDGRVTGGTFEDRMIDVIDLHAGFGSSAAPSANAFFALSPAEQAQVVAFLDSLGRAEFDGVSDPTNSFGQTFIDNEDFEFFRGCFGLTDITADDACAIVDVDQDGDADLDDFAGFLEAYAVQNEVLDCNGNGVADLQEILLDPEKDLDGDYQLDNCDPVGQCAGDLDGDGDTDSDDLGILLSAFGTTGAGDLDNDGDTDSDDLGILLSDFGCDSVVEPGCGSPDAGDCCVANGTPFCNDAACCELICAADPFCCDTQWDQICADAAINDCGICGDPPAGACCLSDGSCLELIEDDCFNQGGLYQGDGVLCADVSCGGGSNCGDPASGNCCEPNGTPFCEDSACCELICAADPFCCDTQWDQICADAALNDCDVCGGGGESDCCIANGTPGCDDPTCQDFICAADPFCCDTQWDQICADAALIDCDVCGGVAPLTGACCLTDGSCVEETAENCIAQGGTYQGDNLLCADVNCNAAPGCGDRAAGDCCFANGTPFCDDAECCNIICVADPFCCDTEWDQICADAAATDCAVCGGGGESDCCIANGTPGCDDPACQDFICAADPFCCDTQWDQICADAAIVGCAICNGGGGGESDCCIANGTPGCDDPACQDFICAADPFCCDTQWDQICADAAIAGCAICDGGGKVTGACCLSDGSCFGAIDEDDCFNQGGIYQGDGILCADVNCGGGGGPSDCCIANGTPGCDDPTCQSQICAADPFCCDTQWDQICADAAIAGCDACNPS
ncbi:MAG: di-heme oxidoredictase family protein [Phycisphaerales bacterium]